MAKPAKPAVDILGVRIDALTIPEAIEKITARPRREGAVYVTKPYVEFFNQDYSQLLNGAWLTLPDGVALQWAAYFQATSGSLWQFIKTLAEIVLAPRRLKQVLPDRFAGINFTWPLLERAAKENLSVYLVGSPIGSDIAHTAATLQQQIPGLSIAGTTPGRDGSGNFSKNLEEQLVNDLKQTRPDLVLIGLGFPRQEKLMQRLTARLDHGVLIGEGGTFDYQQFGGKRPKAPQAMQRVGLEWLWRLLLEPRRIKRQLAIPRFMWRIFRFTN